MPTLTHAGSVQFRSSYTEGDITLARETTFRTDLTDGTSSGQANGYWSGSLTLNAAASTTIDLRGLESLIFGAYAYTGLAAVKQLTIRNTSPGATLTVEPGAADGWSQISGHKVGKSGVSVHYAPVDGLPTTTTSKTVKVTNNSTSVTATGNTTNASTAVTGFSSTSSLAVGMAVSGTGIPAGTTVREITSGTAIVLSAAATATGTAVSLTFQWVAVVEIFAVGVKA